MTRSWYWNVVFFDPPEITHFRFVFRSRFLSLVCFRALIDTVVCLGRDHAYDALKNPTKYLEMIKEVIVDIAIYMHVFLSGTNDFLKVGKKTKMMSTVSWREYEKKKYTELKLTKVCGKIFT